MSDQDPIDLSIPQQWRPEPPRLALDAAPLAPPVAGMRPTHRGTAQPDSDVRIIGEAPVQPAQQPDGSRGIVTAAPLGTGPLCGACAHHSSEHSSFGCLRPGCESGTIDGGACHRWIPEPQPEPEQPPAPPQQPGVQIPGAGWVQ